MPNSTQASKSSSPSRTLSLASKPIVREDVVMIEVDLPAALVDGIVDLGQAPVFFIRAACRDLRDGLIELNLN